MEKYPPQRGSSPTVRRAYIIRRTFPQKNFSNKTFSRRCFIFPPEPLEKLRVFTPASEINRFSKNKTHRILIRKFLFCINHTVTTVTAIETDERTANGVVRLWERAKAERFAVAMTPFVETERSARESRLVGVPERPDKNG